MNIFKKAKIREGREVFSNCHICKTEFKPDSRNKNRGWGLFCSKSCSAKWREKVKDKSDIRDYNLKRLGI
jgi:hypothetical protein